MKAPHKVCSTCMVDKPASEYYGNKKAADGYSSRCKDCVKKAARVSELKRISTPEGIEAERARHREKYYRLEYKDRNKPSPEAKRKIMQRYKAKYPEKYMAKNSSQHIKSGIEGVESHHWSYNEEHWKDVLFIGNSWHNLLHRHVIYDQEHMMYRCTHDEGSFKSGELLDTKERHVSYSQLNGVCFVKTDNQ